MEMFDYVVIGGGSAGCVLAARLSADPAASVLLLEAGGGGRRPEVDDPGRWSETLGTDLDWGYLTEPQAAAAGRRIYWPRGKALGGSGAINAMVYVRGAPSDYDRWEEMGCPGWGFADVLPVFRALEDVPEGDPRYHGRGGPFAPAVPERHNPLSEAVMSAALELGYPFNADPNAASAEGVGWNQLTVADGRRQSAAEACLRPVLGRSNLTVRTYAHVQRLRIEGGRASAVEYMWEDKVHAVAVAGEVVVAAGAIESPKILMLSGVGPADELRSHGIDVCVDVPAVGANLQDHPGVPVTFGARRPIPAGPNQGSEVGLFCRIGSGDGGPDIQFGVLTVALSPDGLITAGSSFSFYPCLLKPGSRGTLRLRSADPSDPPLIDPGYLTDSDDVRTLVGGLEVARDLARAPAMAAWSGDEIHPGPEVRTQAELDAYVERSVNTWFHPVGTCRMGQASDAVVDPQLRVRGLDNVRVADASVMPEIPSGNTNAPTLMIAWKAAELIAEGANA
ncbi:GMC family oxidoreductase N-terminal domain-containing protein [Yinghuangia aomiensis]|uniref:GMC family oxidoreductase N-terminal domain-containing protein n=1 Tax=Yinghuangia aomiensis TaxID=676205 RepID=A0ABP9HUT1_9ACTN